MEEEWGNIEVRVEERTETDRNVWLRKDNPVGTCCSLQAPSKSPLASLHPLRWVFSSLKPWSGSAATCCYHGFHFSNHRLAEETVLDNIIGEDTGDLLWLWHKGPPGSTWGKLRHHSSNEALCISVYLPHVCNASPSGQYKQSYYMYMLVSAAVHVRVCLGV